MNSRYEVVAAPTHRDRLGSDLHIPLYSAAESTDADTRLAGSSTADDWRRLQDLEQRWYRLVREQDLIGAFVAP